MRKAEAMANSAAEEEEMASIARGIEKKVTTEPNESSDYFPVFHCSCSHFFSASPRAA